jgi:glycosyltransferase involved in cell wall biosynthesis
MPELLIDIYKIRDLYSGLGRFSFDFASELVAASPGDYHLHFLVPSERAVEIPGHPDLIRADFRHRYFPGMNRPYDIWHSLHQFPSHKPGRKSRFILTVHDLNFLIEKHGIKARKYLQALQRNIDRADAVTVISHFTGQQLEAHLDLRDKKFRVIYDGVRLSPGNIARPVFVPEGKFFFSIGVFKKSKNFETLLPVMSNFPGFRLIIAGNRDTAYGNHLRDEADRLHLNERIIFPGTVTEDEKAWLYRHCEAFFLPSLAEGFGLPAIEAMLNGKPVFLSRHGSLPEIGGEAAYFFDSFDPYSMSLLIREKLGEYQKDREKISRSILDHAGRFTWENCIRGYLDLYADLLGK